MSPGSAMITSLDDDCMTSGY